MKDGKVLQNGDEFKALKCSCAAVDNFKFRVLIIHFFFLLKTTLYCTFT